MAKVATRSYIFLVLVAAIGLAAYFLVLPMLQSAAVQQGSTVMEATTIQATKHFLDQSHGDQGERARNCLDQHGVFRAYMVKGTNEYHWLCQDSTGTVFDIIVRKLQDKWLGVNDYVAKDGSLDATEAYVKAKGVTQVPPPSGPFTILAP